MFKRRPFGQSAQHEMTKTRFDNSFIYKWIGFIVTARHTAVIAQPAEAALHDPAPGQHHEALGASWGPDYFHAQPQRGGRRGDEWSLVASVGPKELQLRRVGLSLRQHGSRPDGVLHTGGLHQYRQWQTKCIDGDRLLTASYLLACIVAVTAPPLLPVRTDCESIAPAVGSGSRVNWRTCWRNP